MTKEWAYTPLLMPAGTVFLFLLLPVSMPKSLAWNPLLMAKEVWNSGESVNSCACVELLYDKRLQVSLAYGPCGYSIFARANWLSTELWVYIQLLVPGRRVCILLSILPEKSRSRSPIIRSPSYLPIVPSSAKAPDVTAPAYISTSDVTLSLLDDS